MGRRRTLKRFKYPQPVLDQVKATVNAMQQGDNVNSVAQRLWKDMRRAHPEWFKADGYRKPQVNGFKRMVYRQFINGHPKEPVQLSLVTKPDDVNSDSQIRAYKLALVMTNRMFKLAANRDFPTLIALEELTKDQDGAQ